MKRAILALTLTCMFVAPAAADVFEYDLGNGLIIKLRGQISYQGQAVNYRHAKFGQIWLDSSRIVGDSLRKTKPIKTVMERELSRAKNAGDADKIFEVANECLRRGLLEVFYEAVDEVLLVDPEHVGAVRVKKLKEQLDTPLPDSTQQEQELKDYVQNPRMEIAASEHYLLLHDTGDMPIHKSRKNVPRSRERLDLLEKVYEAFIMRFWASGVDLTIPQEKLKVVLFHEHDDYNRFALSLSPFLSSTAGFYDHKTNIAFFYDQGTHESFDVLIALEDLYSELANTATGPSKGNFVRMASGMELIRQVEQERQDIEVVSHEGTHQIAANTGLFPRDVMVPSWVHEGLATYFECPDESEWAGFGAVNEERIDWYRVLAENDPEHANVDFIVGDEIFDLAGSHSSTLHAYAQAWALTHYLMENRFEELMEFYRRLGEMPPDIVLNSELLNDVFKDVFDDSRINTAWHSYMGGLETTEEELERLDRGR